MTMAKSPPPAVSPFAARAEHYVEKGLVILPIAPGTKRPGAYTSGKWHGMRDWGRYAHVSPSSWQIDLWSQWPDAGIGLLCGKLSGVVAVDIDTDDLELIRCIQNIAGPSPVKKKGRKGYTAFYRWDGEAPHSWDVNKQRVVDLLSNGRQTLMPGTQHPDGMTYVYITEDTLEGFDLSELPTLPKTFKADLDAFLEPMQTPEDRAARRERSAEPRDDTHTEIFQSIAAQMWKRINQTALDRLDDWVPDMVRGAKPDGKGYRCRAYWRGAENPNVGITPMGIRDFGQGCGLTPIDLVMYAGNVSFNEAQNALSERLGLNQGGGISITVNQTEPLAKPRPDEPSVDLTKLMTSKPRPSIPFAAVAPRPDFDPLSAALKAKEEERAEEARAQESLLPEFVANAPGLVGEIADWINATAPKTQPEFAVAAALTIGATVMGRRYVTNRDNYPTMWYLIMAHTGEGKDHPQKCVRKVLNAAGLGRLIGGSGYTSAGAVFTALLRQPSHVAIIDEFGQYMKGLNKNGSQNSDSAMSKLMECYTNVNSSVIPPTYSSMTMSKKDMAESEDRTVHNPAISLLCATTPGVFFSALQDDQLEGGMLNRFVMVQTNEPIRVGQMPSRLEPPEGAIAWCKSVTEEHAATGDLRDSNVNDPCVPARPTEMRIDPQAEVLYGVFAQEIVDKRKDMDQTLADLIVRSAEKALRVAMVVAKMTNAPRDNVIRADAMRWAIKYIKHYDYRMVSAVETQRPQSKIESRLRDVEKFMKRVKTYKEAQFVKVTQLGAMPHSLLLRKMKVDSREMMTIMDTAIGTNMVTRVSGVPQVGYAGDVYYLRANLDEE